MIFQIKEDIQEHIEQKEEFVNETGGSRITLLDAHPSVFFSKEFMLYLLHYSRKNPGTQVVLFYKNISLKMVKTAFKTVGVQISGGNNTLKHILSPQQFLLSKIITMFYGANIDLVTKSFLEISNNKTLTRAIHDFTSENDRLLLEKIKLKDDSSMDPDEYSKLFEYKKSLDNSVETSKNKKFNYVQKRSFHCFSSSKSSSLDYTKINYFPLLSKFTGIMGDSNKTDIEKQITLEKFCKEFIKKQTECGQLLINSYKGSLLNFQKGRVKYYISLVVGIIILFLLLSILPLYDVDKTLIIKETSLSLIPVIPVKFYSDAFKLKADILKDNRGKAGIYR